jgi:hypothetical protein
MSSVRVQNYTPKLNGEQQLTIFRLLLDNKTIAEISREMGLDQNYIYDYAVIDPAFAKRMKEIRVMVMHNHVDTLLHITKGTDRTIGEAAMARVESDNIKWAASKVVPDVYGDSINLNVNHHLDLSKALLEADARVLPVLEARKVLEVFEVAEAIEVAEIKENLLIEATGATFADLPDDMK